MTTHPVVKMTSTHGGLTILRPKLKLYRNPLESNTNEVSGKAILLLQATFISYNPETTGKIRD